MSRREDRGSDSKRHRSRFDRDPSPKRSRRDGKPATERRHSDPELDKDRSDRDRKHPRRLQDALPLETPISHSAKVEIGTVSKEYENKAEGNQEGTKHSSDQAKVPRSRSFFQHDDRDNTRQNGRSFSRRTDNERGWWRDSKEQQNDRVENRTSASDSQRKDEKAKDSREEKAKDSREDHRVWRHDGYFEMEANPKPAVRKRPAFREQKVTAAEAEKTNKTATDPILPNLQSRAFESLRTDDRNHKSSHSDRSERPYTGERGSMKGEASRGNFSSRDRYGVSGRYRGRDQYTARQGYRPTGGRVEKWKHDLYNEANRSPPPKNDEEQISKIEALLAS